MNQTSYYKKKIENSINWKATHQNKIHLNPSDYNKLKPETKALGWVKIQIRNGIQGYSDMYRRRFQEDNTLDTILNEIEQKKLEMNTLSKRGQIYNLPSSGLPTNSILINSKKYFKLNKPLYNRYMVLKTLLLELYQEKSRIENILSKL